MTPNPANPNGFIAPLDNIKARLQDEKETLTQRVAEIGGKNRIGDNTLDYHVGYTKGSYYQPYNYNYKFTNSDADERRRMTIRATPTGRRCRCAIPGRASTC